MSCTARGEQGAKIKGMAEEHDEQPRGAVDQVQDDRRDGEREKKKKKANLPRGHLGHLRTQHGVRVLRRGERVHGRPWQTYSSTHSKGVK